MQEVPLVLILFLPRQHRHIGEHILEEDPVTRGGIVDQNMGDGAHDLAVLDDGGAGRECVQVGRTDFHKN